MTQHRIRIECYVTAADCEAMQARIDNETPLDILCDATDIDVRIIPKAAEAEDDGGRTLCDEAEAPEPDEPPACPICSGPGVLLGILGNRIHFRCRNCGMDFSHT